MFKRPLNVSRCARIGVGSVLAQGLLLTAGSVNPALAAFPGADGRMAFDRGGAVYTASIAGGYKETKIAADGKNARWSPNGKRIVMNTKSGQIVTMSPTGGARKTLVTARAFQPSFSPVLANGSQRVLYVRVDPGKGGEVWSVPVGGGTPTRVTTGGSASCGNSWPTWSADGKWIAWVHQAKNADGSCGEVSVLVKNYRTGVSEEVPWGYTDQLYPGDIVPMLGRISFTADSRNLRYQTVPDGCFDILGQYNLVTKEASGELSLSCMEGPTTYEWIAAPSGGDARVKSYYDDNTHTSYPCLTWPVGGYCAVGSWLSWNSIDVQPVPTS